MQFKLDIGNIIKGLAEKEVKTRSALGLYGDTVAKSLESHAKSNYKWIPRSGRAHQSIHGNSSWNGNIMRCSISHGVDYGIYLEICNEQRYAILKPTIDTIGPKAIKGLDKIFK